LVLRIFLYLCWRPRCTLRLCRAQPSGGAEQIDELTAALETRKEELAHPHSDNRRLTDRAEQAEQGLTGAAERLREAGTAATETRAVREELTAERQRFAGERDRLRAQADQARQAKAQADTTAVAAVATAETALQLTRADLQQARRQLATAQAATGLAVPDLADLADELEAGVSGVLLPEAAITAVTRHPDGTVVLYHQGGQIPLGATTSDPQALAAALLAVAADRPPTPAAQPPQ
jgi:hypothetical protein